MPIPKTTPSQKLFLPGNFPDIPEAKDRETLQEYSARLKEWWSDVSTILTATKQDIVDAINKSSTGL